MERYKKVISTFFGRQNCYLTLEDHKVCKNIILRYSYSIRIHIAKHQKMIDWIYNIILLNFWKWNISFMHEGAKAWNVTTCRAGDLIGGHKIIFHLNNSRPRWIRFLILGQEFSKFLNGKSSKYASEDIFYQQMGNNNNLVERIFINCFVMVLIFLYLTFIFKILVIFFWLFILLI